jgi:hypothetical protein
MIKGKLHWGDGPLRVAALLCSPHNPLGDKGLMLLYNRQGGSHYDLEAVFTN